MTSFDFIYDGLNEQQKNAVCSPARALLIIAGAGTGKTKTLTSRIVYFLTQGISPREICALTFTNKAAREMGERVERLMKQIASSDKNNQKPLAHLPYLGTFHSFGAFVLRRECALIPRSQGFVIYDAHDSLSLIKKIIKSVSRGGTELSSIKPARIAEQISSLKNNSLHLNSLLQSQLPHDLFLVSVYQAYEKALLENNAFDFDDLLCKTVLLFKEHPDVLLRYQRMCRYLLVDEYQDINILQYELIKLLVGRDGFLTVVGDDAQTIYTWRGSDISIFLNFETYFAQAQLVYLEENYRSTGHILEAAGEVIAKNTVQKEKKLWTRAHQGELVGIIEASDEDSEGEAVVERIVSVLRENEQPSKSIAILYRTNSQSRPIEQALLRLHIPYAVYGGLKFYERREIKDIMAGLRLISNPQDSVSRDRLDKAFLRGQFREVMTALSAQSSTILSPKECIFLFLETAHYFEYIQKNLSNVRERKENIEELIRFSSRFSALSDFLEQASLAQALDPDPSNKQPPAISLMSIHSSKGLEFDVVFLIGAQEGFLPHMWSLSTPAQLEEERRLLYVAMTRAKQKLWISYHNRPSRFLFDIPHHLTDFSSENGFAASIDDPSDERYITID